MTLRIISAEKIEFEGEVTKVTLPGELGSFEVLKNHAALISSLTSGTLTWTEGDDDKPQSRTISGGLADIKSNVVSVCLY